MNSGSLILLVEDLEDDVLLFTEVMKRSGLCNPIRIVRDGVTAVNYLDGRGRFADRGKFPLPKVLVLDLTLPKMNGWDVLKWVRSDPEFKDLLVVVLTVSLRVSDLERAYQMGANSFLTKPCGREDLMNLARAFPEHWVGASDLPQELKAAYLENSGG